MRFLKPKLLSRDGTKTSDAHNETDARSAEHIVAHAAARRAAGFKRFHPAATAHGAHRFASHSNQVDGWGGIRFADEIGT
jgi:hypothetical protein